MVNAYVLALAALVALGGKAADLLGRRRAFQIGVTLFFVASAGCAFAWDATSVIAFRALQGAGAALMMPVSATIVLGAFPEGERGRVMALYAGISQVFLALGPLVGGLLTEYVTWRAVFLLNVPVGIATLVLVAVARVPNTSVPGARIGLADAALVVSGLAMITLGIQQLGSWGGIAVGLLVVGVGLIGWFVARQLRSTDPLIHLRLFADRGFTGDAVVMGLVQFGLLGIVLYSSIYMQELLGFGPMAAGLATLPLILPLTLAAQVGGRWFDRAGVRSPVHHRAGGVHGRDRRLAGHAAVVDLRLADPRDGAGRRRAGAHDVPDEHRRARPRLRRRAQPGLRCRADRPAVRRHARRRRDRRRGARPRR